MPVSNTQVHEELAKLDNFLKGESQTLENLLGTFVYK